MKKIVIHDPNNIEQHKEINPRLKQWVERVVKIELHLLDGSIKEAKLTFPLFTFWSDPDELAGTYLSAWINHMTKHFLKLKSFQVHLGSINDKGEEIYSIHYAPDEIPLNKVYVPRQNIKGRWVKPETEKRRQQRAKLKKMEKNMSQNRHPVSGQIITMKKPKSWEN